MLNSLSKSRLSFKARAFATVIALFSAVALPQIAHLIGGHFGVGTSLGEMLLPMHLPVILAGFLAGPTVGVAVGVFAPVISFALTGMPLSAILPFMVIELGTYGLVAGILSNVKITGLVKILCVQVAGRLVKMLAIFVAGNILHLTQLSPKAVLTAIPTGIFGIILQLVLICFADWKMSKNGRI